MEQKNYNYGKIMTIIELINKFEELKSKYGNIEITNLEGYRVTQVYYSEYEDLDEDYSIYPEKSIIIA